MDESSYVRRRACLVGNRRWYFSNRDGKESNTEKETEKEPPTDVSIEFDQVGEGGVVEDEDGTNEERNVLGTDNDINVSVAETADTNLNEFVVAIGKKGKGVKVRRAKVNELALVDIFKVAMDQLIKLNLPVSRRRKKLRAEREQKLKKRLLDEVKARKRASGGRNPLVEEAFTGIRLLKRRTNEE